MKKGELARLRQENAELRRIAVGLQINSRRYCDGRSTYAPGEHNRLTHAMLRLGIEIPVDPISVTGPFAADGTYGLERRDYEVLERMKAEKTQEGEYVTVS